MRSHLVSRQLAAFGAAFLLSGCIGEPRTYYAAKPIVLQQRPVARVSKKSAPAPSTLILSTPVLSASNTEAPILSADEKQQLFHDFQASQGRKDPTPAAPGPTAAGAAP